MNNLDNEQSNLVEVDNQYWVNLCQALTRLHDNPDFKKVILEGYFTDKAVDGVSLLAQDSIVQSGKRTAVMEDLIAISSLRDYFMTIMNLGYVPEDGEEDEELEE